MFRTFLSSAHEVHVRWEIFKLEIWVLRFGFYNLQSSGSFRLEHGVWIVAQEQWMGGLFFLGFLSFYGPEASA